MLEIRLLKETDTMKFFEHRLEGLRLVPTAIGGTYEDEKSEGCIGIYQTFMRLIKKRGITRIMGLPNFP